MDNTQKNVALIGAAGAVIAAMVAGLFMLFSDPSVQQQTNCGAAIANTSGSVTISGDTKCDENKP